MPQAKRGNPSAALEPLLAAVRPLLVQAARLEAKAGHLLSICCNCNFFCFFINENEIITKTIRAKYFNLLNIIIFLNIYSNFLFITVQTIKFHL
jgi:hypothetical protein